MTSKGARLCLRATLLAIACTFSHAGAQWATIKASLQKEVRILEETPERLVLCREDSTGTLIMTIAPSKTADIYGALEARRGGNAYRIWVITENFWNKPHLAEDGGRKFLKESLVRTLRPEPAAPEAAEDPPVETPAPVEEPAVTSRPDYETEVAEPVEIPELPAEALATQSAPADSLRVAVNPEALPTPAKRPARPREAKQKSKSARQPKRQAAKPAKPKEKAKNTSSPPIPTPAAFTVAVPPASVVRSPLAALDSLYHAAQAEIEKENWQPAIAMLEKIQSLEPEYRDVSERLVQARIKLNSPERHLPSVESRESVRPSLFAGGAVVAMGAFVALIVLPLIGVVLFSTTFRARYHMFRGEPAQAAQLYERQLARRPGKTKLYAELANAYLLLGRRDEQAMKIYKTVLQLKLVTKNREAVTAMLAQKYLAEGRTDVDMIEVLEDALKAERRKHGQNPSSDKA